MMSPDIMSDDNNENMLEFELEPKILQYLNELQLYRNSSYRADAINAEQRADNLATARKVAEKAAEEARREAASATTAAHRATSQVATLLEEVATYKTRADLAEREKKSLAEECTNLVVKLNSIERERDELRSKIAAHALQQNAYKELKQRAESAAERTEAAVRRLEADLRRVESAVNAGAELRERARLAAAEHARDRAWLERDLANIKQQLINTLAELNKLKAESAESKYTKHEESPTIKRALEKASYWEIKASELHQELDNERETTAKLSAALAGATASVSKLSESVSTSDKINSSNIAPITEGTYTLQKPGDSVPQSVSAVKAFLEE